MPRGTDTNVEVPDEACSAQSQLASVEGKVDAPGSPDRDDENGLGYGGEEWLNMASGQASSDPCGTPWTPNFSSS